MSKKLVAYFSASGITEKVAKQIGVNYLFSDFKKENGYQHSIELSRKYNLYRQNYCGCKYSKIAREKFDLQNLPN